MRHHSVGMPLRPTPSGRDPVLYRQRHRIETMLSQLKDWRRIHTRLDRCAHTFLPAMPASAIFWLGTQCVLSLDD